jgi:uncharacterized membrane protein
MARVAFGQPTYNVVTLGSVQSTGDSGKSINSSGVVAFTQSTEIYLYKNGVISPVTGVTANNGPLGINDSGDLAGSYNQGGFLDKNGVITEFGQSQLNFVQGLNDSDVLVGEAYNYSVQAYRGFTWQNGIQSPLPAPSSAGYGQGDGSSALAINTSGQIAGYYDALGATQAVVWSSNLTATLLPTLGGYTRSSATAINNNGTLAGDSFNSSDQNSHPDIWTNGQVQALPSLAGFDENTANAINDNNEVVGWAYNDSATQGGDAEAWFNGQLVDLNTLIPANSGWHLTDAEAVNDSGLITGWGYLNGQQASFLLVPVPEPGSIAVVTIGTIALLRRRPAV